VIRHILIFYCFCILDFKSVKTVLFAFLIVAMTPQFSGMGMVHAEESLKEKQMSLLDRLEVIEEKITYTDSEKKIQRLEAQKQLILEKLFNNAGESNNEITKQLSKNSKDVGIDGNSDFYINGSHKGCDDINETWNYRGTMTSGSGWVSIEQNYPSQLTSGSAPDCSSWDWESNVYLEMRDLFNLDNGCQGNLITAPVTSYWINCQTPIQGFWIVKVTANYEFNQVSGFTLINIF